MCAAKKRCVGEEAVTSLFTNVMLHKEDKNSVCIYFTQTKCDKCQYSLHSVIYESKIFISNDEAMRLLNKEQGQQGHFYRPDYFQVADEAKSKNSQAVHIHCDKQLKKFVTFAGFIFILIRELPQLAIPLLQFILEPIDEDIRTKLNSIEPLTLPLGDNEKCEEIQRPLTKSHQVATYKRETCTSKETVEPSEVRVQHTDSKNAQCHVSVQSAVLKLFKTSLCKLEADMSMKLFSLQKDILRCDVSCKKYMLRHLAIWSTQVEILEHMFASAENISLVTFAELEQYLSLETADSEAVNNLPWLSSKVLCISQCIENTTINNYVSLFTYFCNHPTGKQQVCLLLHDLHTYNMCSYIEKLQRNQFSDCYILLMIRQSMFLEKNVHFTPKPKCVISDAKETSSIISKFCKLARKSMFGE